MATSREAKARIAALGEIGDIVGAMKNLALLELQKLGRLRTMERRAVHTIEVAAADLSRFFLAERPGDGAFADMYLMVGSERSFCGDFNETLVAAPARGTVRGPPPEAMLVAIGTRLAIKLREAHADPIVVPGACVAEEIPGVLAALAGELAALQRGAGGDRPLRLTVCYHDAATEVVCERRLAPMPESSREAAAHPYPPLIHLPPAELFRRLFDQYLYAALHEALNSSLTAENQERLVHMDNAMRRIDERVSRLKLEYNARRQEEITEEIEVILLSAEATGSAR